MKISVSNTFDVSTIANTKSFQDLQEYFEYSNKFTSDVVDCLSNKVTLKDNVTYSEKSLTIQHNVPINLGAIKFTYIFLKSTTPIKSYTISQDKSANYILTVQFNQSQNAVATSAVWVAGTTVRYKVQNVANYNIGDSVVFSSFGTAANNGTYLITSKDATNSYLYVQNHNRTSATGDETRQNYVGNTQTTNTITLGTIV